MKTAMILGLVMGVAGSAAAASAGTLPPRVIVRIYSGDAVLSSDLTTAAATVRSLLKDAAIELVWRDCSAPASADGPCNRGLDANEVIVRFLVAGDGSAPKHALGNAMISGDPGCFVTIWIDHVVMLARAGNVMAGQLLGRAITHELGHVLLGTVKHSAVGLMRAEWTEHELRRDRPSDWMVSRDERKALQRGLSARLRQSPPATAAAGL